MRSVKYYDFWPNFQSVLSINHTLFDIETQNLKVRSITETVLEKLKKKIQKNFLEPDAFSYKQYCEN